MSDTEKNEIIGRLVRERNDAIQEEQLLMAVLRGIGQALGSLGHALQSIDSSPPEKVPALMLKADDACKADWNSVKDLVPQYTAAKQRAAGLTQQLKDLGISLR